MIDRTGPLVVDGRGWLAYPWEVAQGETAIPEPNVFEVRTPEQIEADEWAYQAHAWRRCIAWTTGDPVLIQCASEQYDLAQAWMWGHFAPTERHARRLALYLIDFRQQFIRRMSDETAYALAVAVLTGWEAAHGGA